MKKVYCVILAFHILLCLTGCDTYEMTGYYPENRSAVWYCEELDFEIKYIPNEYGNLIAQASTITWNGVLYNVVGVFNFGYFEIISVNDELIAKETSVLLSGAWDYENENVVVEITEDNVFGNAFEVLVFKPIG